MSTTVETFQDLSLPIPGKEDLAKLHIYQNVPAKPGACGDSYAAQGWLAFIVEYIRRYPSVPACWRHDTALALEGSRPYTAKFRQLQGQGQSPEGPLKLEDVQVLAEWGGGFLSHEGMAWVGWAHGSEGG